MKEKTTKKVIADLYRLYKIGKQTERESVSFGGLFMIGKGHIKTSKAKKMLAKYLEKVTITDGHVKVVKRTTGFFKFKILNYESEKKKRQRQKQVRKKIKQARKKATIKQSV